MINTLYFTLVFHAQYIELQLIEEHHTTIFLQKQIVETFLLSTIKNGQIAHPWLKLTYIL